MSWKPRLKDAKKRKTGVADGSMGAAELALANMGAIEKRRARGVAIDDDYVSSLASRCRAGKADAAAAATRGDARAGGRKAGSSRRGLVAALAVCACALAVTLVFSGVLGTSSMHRVAGRLLFERRPASDVEIRFHPSSDADAGPSVVTAKDGKFEVAGLPKGQYLVTLHATGESGPALPPAYAEPQSALFTLNVNRDVHNVQLYAYRKPPQPRKAAWTPGVD